MLITLAKLAAVCLLLATTPALAKEKSADLKPNRVRVEYVAPKNPAHQHIHDRLREQQVLERLAEFVSPFRLPRPVLMKLDTCGVVNAFYQDAVIYICYEYIQYIFDNMPKQPVSGGLTPRDAVIGPTVHVVLHEFGHGVFDLLQIPVFAREEDASDMFSSYIQLQTGHKEARVLLLGMAFLGARQTQEEMANAPELREYADTHSLPAQRYFNILCMSYGFDPQLFADAVSQWYLPPNRARGCADEYAKLQHAFEMLVRPHIDQALWEKVQAGKLLAFDIQP
jgi:hypothetical protein